MHSPMLYYAIVFVVLFVLSLVFGRGRGAAA
jgi:uncharacterized membrane protein YtjA (UPF0391 family)